jgi:hypothetical protein
MKLTRCHAYVVVPGLLAGGALLGTASGWNWVAIGAGALIGGLAAPAGLAIGQWLVSQLMSAPYHP